MINPNRFRQNAQKTVFTTVAQQWRALTQADRDAWIAYASAFPRPSRLNPSSYLNGFNYFCAANNLRQITNPGTFTTNPWGGQGTATFNDALPGYSGGNFGVDLDVFTTGAYWKYILYLTGRIGDGQEYVQQTPKVITTGNAPVGSFLNLNAAYLAIFGSLPPLNSWIGVAVKAIKIDNGQIFEFGPDQRQVINL